VSKNLRLSSQFSGKSDPKALVIVISDEVWCAETGFLIQKSTRLSMIEAVIWAVGRRPVIKSHSKRRTSWIKMCYRYRLLRIVGTLNNELVASNKLCRKNFKQARFNWHLKNKFKKQQTIVTTDVNSSWSKLTASNYLINFYVFLTILLQKALPTTPTS
jgi:hypothetical protein